MAIYPDRKDAMSGLFSKTAKAVGRNGLSYRLLSYILVCSTVLAMIITVLQLAWDYRKDVAVIEDSIGQIEASFLQPIAASLWNLDEEQVKVQIEGIMNLPNMQFVMVKEMLGNSEVPLLTQGTERESYDISREFNLTYQGEIVGKLFVAASLEQIYQRLIEGSTADTTQAVAHRPSDRDESDTDQPSGSRRRLVRLVGCPPTRRVARRSRSGPGPGSSARPTARSRVP